MLDVNKLDDLFEKDEILLHNTLLSHFSKIAIDEKLPVADITINSTLIEVAKYYHSLEGFEKEYEERKRIAPNWETALEMWITEIENEYLTERKLPFYSYVSELPHYIIDFKKPLLFKAYSDITEGKNLYLYQYAKYMVKKSNDNKKYIDVWNLRDIAQGVAFAYKLPKLKSELKQIRDFGEITPIDIQPLKQRLTWKGTPAQFGFIIDLLIQGGYLEKPTASFLKDANIYLEHFNIKTTIGTLSKEISENTNSVTPANRNKINIPNKDKIG